MGVVDGLWLRVLARARYLYAGITASGRFRRLCNLCGYHGYFGPGSKGTQRDSKCPRCGSNQRHRLFKLWFDQNRGLVEGRDLLHFAPERQLAALIKPLAASYISGDIQPHRADRVVDIEDMPFEAERFDFVLCCHVLAHVVDDEKALSEIHRVLRPSGCAAIMTPVIEGWAHTYEDAALTTPRERMLHFGQKDAFRYYGQDIRDRLAGAGFDVSEFAASGSEVARHGLLPGEKVFIVRRRR
jgi:SAM-dependent methyltransferase